MSIEKKSLQVPFHTIIYSKPTILAQTFIQNYLGVFDFYTWGVRGRENIFQFSLFVHGFMYLSSIPLFIYGFSYLRNKHTETTKKVLLFLAISPITSAITIGQTQNMFRSGLTYALILLFIGIGLYAVIEKYKKYSLIIFSILLLEVVYFGLVYFSRYPIVTADNHYFNEKLTASYVSRVTNPVVIVTENPGQSYTLARSVIYYSQILNKLSDTERKAFVVGKDEYVFANTTVTNKCPAFSENTIYLVAPALLSECFETSPIIKQPQPQKKIGLGSPIDSRIYFYVLNDTICDQNTLKKYVYQNEIQMFDILKLSNKAFCDNWMISE